MIDPSNALSSFQEALLGGGLSLQRGHFDKELFVHLDHPNGRTRLTYAKLDRRTVTAFVEFVQIDPIDETPCFHVGCAVPERYRNQGRATDAVNAAIAEMQHGLGRAGVNVFYVEAVVGIENRASQRVAEKTISEASTSIIDSVSGLPALQYLRQIGR